MFYFELIGMNKDEVGHVRHHVRLIVCHLRKCMVKPILKLKLFLIRREYIRS